MHTNPDLFPDPMAFVPERWLHPESQKLENYLVPFSKGPRSCVGIKYVPSASFPWVFFFASTLSSDPCTSLAWCELYLVFGNMLRKLDMQLYNTTYVSPYLHIFPSTNRRLIVYLFLAQTT